MSHSACSMPLIAALITAPPGKRVKLYMVAHRYSTLRGSLPISHPLKSLMVATVASSGPTEYASPKPYIPASVRILTKHRLRPPAFTKKLWMSVIFSSGLPVYRGEACDIACACKGNPIVPPWTRNSRRFMGGIVPVQRGQRVMLSQPLGLVHLCNLCRRR